MEDEFVEDTLLEDTLLGEDKVSGDEESVLAPDDVCAVPSCCFIVITESEAAVKCVFRLKKEEILVIFVPQKHGWNKVLLHFLSNFLFHLYLH